MKRILFAVKDPNTQRETAAQQAIMLAKALRASIEFFHSISSPVFMDLQPLTGASLTDLKREAVAGRREGLDKLVALARKKGVRASSHVTLSAARAVLSPRCDLVACKLSPPGSTRSSGPPRRYTGATRP